MEQLTKEDARRAYMDVDTLIEFFGWDLVDDINESTPLNEFAKALFRKVQGFLASVEHQLPSKFPSHPEGMLDRPNHIEGALKMTAPPGTGVLYDTKRWLDSLDVRYTESNATGGHSEIVGDGFRIVIQKIGPCRYNALTDRRKLTARQLYSIRRRIEELGDSLAHSDAILRDREDSRLRLSALFEAEMTALGYTVDLQPLTDEQREQCEKAGLTVGNPQDNEEIIESIKSGGSPRLSEHREAGQSD